jgi:cystathionine gamma-lyase
MGVSTSNATIHPIGRTQVSSQQATNNLYSETDFILHEVHMKKDLSIETLAIHAGITPDPSTGAVMTPIYQTSTYQQEQVGIHKGYEYSRTHNPTRHALELNLAALEGGERALAFASGMAATDAVLRLLKPGEHVLAGNDLYGGTYRIFQQVYDQYGLDITYAEPSDPEAFLEHRRPETRLVWLETPTNPLLNICDIAAISAGSIDHQPAPWVCVDNTFATPYLQQPLSLGADLVVHSTTKYLGGHSDVIGGAVVTTDVELAERLAFLQNAVGAVPGPMDCFLVLRGIKTLHVRMDRHAANALEIVKFLVEHKMAERVYYPTLDSHPQADLAQRQMRNGGGMISFTVSGGVAQAHKIVEATQLFTLAESLGGVESLIEIPAAMTHASTSDSQMAVDPALIRLSVGLEAVSDLIADLEQAFDRSLD